MSFILTLDEDKLEEIIPLLPRYEKKIAASEQIFKLDGRRLEEVARTLPAHQASYDQSYQELKALEEWINNIKEKRIGKLWKKYLEGYQRTLSTRDIQAYINSEKEIVDLNQIIIEVTLLKNNTLAIVEAIKNLGWMVGHITKIRIAELQETIL